MKITEMLSMGTNKIWQKSRAPCTLYTPQRMQVVSSLFQLVLHVLTKNLLVVLVEFSKF